MFPKNHKTSVPIHVGSFQIIASKLLESLEVSEPGLHLWPFSVPFWHRECRLIQKGWNKRNKNSGSDQLGWNWNVTISIHSYYRGLLVCRSDTKILNYLRKLLQNIREISRPTQMRKQPFWWLLTHPWFKFYLLLCLLATASEESASSPGRQCW